MARAGNGIVLLFLKISVSFVVANDRHIVLRYNTLLKFRGRQ